MKYFKNFIGISAILLTVALILFPYTSIAKDMDELQYNLTCAKFDNNMHRDQSKIEYKIKNLNADIERLERTISIVDKYIFVNGNYEWMDINNYGTSFILDYPAYIDNPEGRWSNYTEYCIYWTSGEIDQINKCGDDLNLFIYSLGKNYYSYNYLWKNLNSNIESINKDIRAWNKKYPDDTYGYNITGVVAMNELPYITSIYDSYEKYKNDKNLQERWSYKEKWFGYDIFPQG